MEQAARGRVLVAAKLENMYDLFEVAQGRRPLQEVRSVEVQDALVDTGTTQLGLPPQHIQHLGLEPFTTRKVRSTTGVRDCRIFGPVQLTVQGRQCRMDVAEVPADCPVLIGQVPLEVLDFLVDPVGQRLVGNPAHGGEQMLEQF